MNLAPADLPKAGPAYDLPIAMAILVSTGQVSQLPESALFLGELSLDGSLRHTNGVLPMVVVARDEGLSAVYVPVADAGEAALVEGIDVVPVSSLSELASHIRGEALIEAVVSDGRPDPSRGDSVAAETSGGVDLAHIRGQEHAKRALEVAAAGGHNLFTDGTALVASCLGGCRYRRLARCIDGSGGLCGVGLRRAPESRCVPRSPWGHRAPMVEPGKNREGACSELIGVKPLRPTTVRPTRVLPNGPADQ